MLLIHSDIHYLVSAISGAALLTWMYSIKGHRNDGNSDAFSSKTLSTSLLLLAVLGGMCACWGGIGAMLKYYYGYVQVPFRMNFLQRPYATYPLSNAWLLWMVEVVGAVLGIQCKYLGLYLGLIVLWNAATLTAISGNQSPQSPLVNVSRAIWIAAAGSGTLVVGWLMQRWLGVLGRSILVVVTATLWVPWILMLQARIKSLMLKSFAASSHGRTGNGQGNRSETSSPSESFSITDTVPRFRVNEEIRNLNTFSAFVLVDWIGLIGSLVVVGEGKSPFWLDVFSILNLFGYVGSIAILFHLMYPQSICNYRRQK